LGGYAPKKVGIMENKSAIYRVLKGEPLLKDLSLRAWNEYDDLKNINELKGFAEYASISWEDGEWLVSIEKVNGVRVDMVGERSSSLAVAIHTAMKAAQQSVQSDGGRGGMSQSIGA
jgi:hypothetical protein